MCETAQPVGPASHCEYEIRFLLIQECNQSGSSDDRVDSVHLYKISSARRDVVVQSAPSARQNSTTSSPDDSVHPSRQQFTGGVSTPFNSTYTDSPLLEEEELPSEDDILTVSGSGSVTGAQTGTETRTPAQTQIRTRGYNTLKTHRGQIYTGMAIGGSHTWNYDPGIWKETKEEPDRWRIDYATNKRRARSVPTGSGAPVGTEYHWLIVAHQVSVKVKMGKQESDVAVTLMLKPGIGDCQPDKPGGGAKKTI